MGREGIEDACIMNDGRSQTALGRYMNNGETEKWRDTYERWCLWWLSVGVMRYAFVGFGKWFAFKRPLGTDNELLMASVACKLIAGKWSGEG